MATPNAQLRSDSEARLAYLARSMIGRTSMLPRRASGILEATIVVLGYD